MGDIGPPVRILHVVQTLDPAFGGPSRVAVELGVTQAEEGHEVTIVAARTGMSSLADDLDCPAGLRIIELPVLWRPLLYCRGMITVTRREVRRAHVVHVHGAYRLPVTLASWLAWLHRRPLVTRPHGTYDAALREISTHNRWTRAIYEHLLERPILRSPRSVVQCTSAQEADDLVRLMPSIRHIRVVGNGVGVPPVRSADRETTRAHWRLPAGAIVYLYLGRITPKKRLDLLLEAFTSAALCNQSLRLVIAGGDESGLREELEMRFPSDKVIWCGHVDGDLREALFSMSDVFVLTSSTENYGVAPVEAAARGLPLILSSGVGARHLFDESAAIITELSASSIRSAILCFAEMDVRERTDMGLGAKRAWAERAAWSQLAPQIEQLYLHAQTLV